MSEYCRGCAVISENDKACDEGHNDNGECPCTECLIKSMCANECDPYRKYVNKILILGDRRPPCIVPTVDGDFILK